MIEIDDEKDDKEEEETTVVMMAAAAAVTSILRVLMVGALSQLWGLINGLSLIVHVPLIKYVIIPEGTIGSLNFLIEIAQFDIAENE